jgi:SWI/SNF-related matrix-associated actin-dependent regulator 1 of chromatin subfamily A
MDSDPIEETPPPKRPTMTYSQDEYGEDLFDADTLQHIDTIATQPLLNYRAAVPYSSPSNVSSPPAPHYTQPTQILSSQQRTPNRIQYGSQIQVPQSVSPKPLFRTDNSRFAQPSQSSQPVFNRANMAPPGTVYRPPMPAQPAYPMASNSNKTFSQMTNYDDPPLAADSDSDGDRHRSDIPPASFVFQERMGQFYHNGSTTAPQKRVAEDSASAYGGLSRPPKMPRKVLASTLPDKQLQDIELSHIEDWEEREKVSRIRQIFPSYPIVKSLSMLRAKKGHTDDAIAAIMTLLEDERSMSPENVIELSDDDEVQIIGVARSRLGQAVPAKPTAKRGIEGKGASIRNMYSKIDSKIDQPKQPLQPKAISQPRPITSSSTISVPSAPSTPQKKPLKRIRQGRPAHLRVDSSPVAPSPVAQAPAEPSPQQFVPIPRTRKRVDSDEYDSEAEAEPEPREDIEDQAFQYFNKTATEQDLRDMTNCTAEEATLILSKRPFRSLDSVRKVAVQPKDIKAKRGGGNRKTLGDRIVDKVVEMMTGLEAVDRVVKKCEGFSDQLRSALKKLGIDTDKATSEDGLALTSFGDNSRIDSGVVTPTSSSDNLVPQPAIMSSTESMKDFQIVGMNWLNLMFNQGQKWSRQSGCILADEMGLGKTLQIISFLSHLLETNNDGPHLIVVPSSTLENWLREMKRFSPRIHVEPYYGNQNERVEMQSSIEHHLRNETKLGGKINVIITTYTLASKLKDNYWLRKTFDFKACIFDEGHMLKNRDSERYRALKKIRANFRVLLTGTPLQNNLQELVSVLAFIMPDLFDDCEEDLDLIFSHKAKTTDLDHAALLSAQRIARAKTMLTPFILRRTKDQVMKDLPAKIRRVEYCDMTPRQRQMYEGYTQRHQEILEARKAGKPIDDEKVPHLMHRRLAAIHPLLHRVYYDDETIRKQIVPLVPRKGKYKGWGDQKMLEEFTWLSDYELHSICRDYGETKKDKDGKKIPGIKQLKRLMLQGDEWMDSGKVNKLVELIKRFSAENAGVSGKEPSRTLVFSQFVKTLDILEEVMQTEGIAFVRIDGATPVDHRQKIIDRFYREQDIQVFMITTRSGGAGINLACANKVIVFDSSFNPQDDIQAENRAHRIGQTREVEVVTLITKDTIEEQIYKLGQSKLALDKRVAGAADADAIAKENEALLETLLMEGKDIPTPPSELTNGDDTNANVASGVKAKETSGKEDAGEESDLKDAFADGMRAKGLDIKGTMIQKSVVSPP